jgi:hypothetical protein
MLPMPSHSSSPSCGPFLSPEASSESSSLPPDGRRAKPQNPGADGIDAPVTNTTSAAAAFGERLSADFREIARTNHANGRQTFRLAAMRAFEACGDRDAARVVLDLEVDAWLTSEERALIERMP